MYLSKLDDRLETRIKKDEMAKLLVIILENSTIMPFRWYSNKYMCFYCCYDFVDSKLLKEHTKEEHADLNSYNVLRSLLKNARVKLDVSEIACKKCPKAIKSFEDFLEHAAKAHEIVYDKSVVKHFFCFKLSDDAMGCIECGLQFRFFGPLLTHVHKHHNKIANKFLCEICGQSFIAKVNVQSHMKNVHGSYNGRKCEKCGKTFTSNYALNQHSMKEHKTDRLKCPKCPEVLGSRYLKKRHLALVHDEKSSQFACELCPRVYLAKSALVTHNLRVHVREKTFTCEICGYKSFDKENLQRHMVKHDDSRPFECEFCKKNKLSSPIKSERMIQYKKWKDGLVKLVTLIREYSTIIPFRWFYNKYYCFYCAEHFLDSKKLKQHTKEEHTGFIRNKLLRSLIKKNGIKLDISEIACKKCPKTIKSFEEFLEHIGYAHDVKYDSDVTQHCASFKLSDDGMGCIVCGQRFRFFGPLLRHVHKNHNNNNYVCEYCSQTFLLKKNLANHIKKVHKDENIFKCVECGKKFISAHTLDKHLTTDHKTFILQCPKCPEVLGSRYLKKRHLALVHDEKTYQIPCELCHKVYLSKSALVRHNLRVHVRERSFNCDICDYKSFTNNTLQDHKLKHYDVRAFECEYCKKTFQRKKNLQIHRRIHTNDKRCVCSECGKAFVQNTSLKLHLRVHHSIVKNDASCL
ncbi:Zinc finger protein 850 [Papilio machaon]|uniref:Zinc finger protein 850 n=1 Tax=Papilio machaon TaxID=76193 RepID=A0A0N0PEF0_PAPMA|nr:Zinc finger protein 850 [Papilio machaon]